MNPPVLNVFDSLLSVIIIIRFHRSVHVRQFDLSSKIHINSGSLYRGTCQILHGIAKLKIIKNKALATV